jgi:hypothetical protein
MVMKVKLNIADFLQPIQSFSPSLPLKSLATSSSSSTSVDNSVTHPSADPPFHLASRLQ